MSEHQLVCIDCKIAIVSWTEEGEEMSVEEFDGLFENSSTAHAVYCVDPAWRHVVA